MTRVGVDAVRVERFARLGGDRVGPEEAMARAAQWATVEALAKCLEMSAVLVDPSMISVDGSGIVLAGRLGQRAADVGIEQLRRDMWLTDGNVVVTVEATKARP